MFLQTLFFLLSVVKGNKIVSDFRRRELAINSYSQSTNSQCHSNAEACCLAWGDPHYTTFDGNKHHFQGICSYKYITPCDGSFTRVPYEIVAAHESCYAPGRSCIKEIIVRLYESGNLHTEIKLGDNFSATYVSSGNSVPKGVYHSFNGGNANYFILSNSADMELFIKTGAISFAPGERQYDVRIKVKKSFGPLGNAKIFVSECWKTDICGLCGYYDSDNSNDLLLGPFDSIYEVDASAPYSSPKVRAKTLNYRSSMRNMGTMGPADHNDINNFGESYKDPSSQCTPAPTYSPITPAPTFQPGTHRFGGWCDERLRVFYRSNENGNNSWIMVHDDEDVAPCNGNVHSTCYWDVSADNVNFPTDPCKSSEMLFACTNTAGPGGFSAYVYEVVDENNFQTTNSHTINNFFTFYNSTGSQTGPMRVITGGPFNMIRQAQYQVKDVWHTTRGGFQGTVFFKYTFTNFPNVRNCGAQPSGQPSRAPTFVGATVPVCQDLPDATQICNNIRSSLTNACSDSSHLDQDWLDSCAQDVCAQCEGAGITDIDPNNPQHVATCGVDATTNANNLCNPTPPITVSPTMNPTVPTQNPTQSTSNPTQSPTYDSISCGDSRSFGSSGEVSVKITVPANTNVFYLLSNSLMDCEFKSVGGSMVYSQTQVSVNAACVFGVSQGLNPGSTYIVTVKGSPSRDVSFRCSNGVSCDESVSVSTALKSVSITPSPGKTSLVVDVTTSAVCYFRHASNGSLILSKTTSRHPTGLNGCIFQSNFMVGVPYIIEISASSNGVATIHCVTECDKDIVLTAGVAETRVVLLPSSISEVLVGTFQGQGTCVYKNINDSVLYTHTGQSCILDVLSHNLFKAGDSIKVVVSSTQSETVKIGCTITSAPSPSPTPAPTGSPTGSPSLNPTSPPTPKPVSDGEASSSSSSSSSTDSFSGVRESKPGQGDSGSDSNNDGQSDSSTGDSQSDSNGDGNSDSSFVVSSSSSSDFLDSNVASQSSGASHDSSSRKSDSHDSGNSGDDDNNDGNSDSSGQGAGRSKSSSHRPEASSSSSSSVSGDTNGGNNPGDSGTPYNGDSKNSGSDSNLDGNSDSSIGDSGSDSDNDNNSDSSLYVDDSGDRASSSSSSDFDPQTGPSASSGFSHDVSGNVGNSDGPGNNAGKLSGDSGDDNDKDGMSDSSNQPQLNGAGGSESSSSSQRKVSPTSKPVTTLKPTYRPGKCVKEAWYSTYSGYWSKEGNRRRLIWGKSSYENNYIPDCPKGYKFVEFAEENELELNKNNEYKVNSANYMLNRFTLSLALSIFLFFY